MVYIRAIKKHTKLHACINCYLFHKSPIEPITIPVVLAAVLLEELS